MNGAQPEPPGDGFMLVEDASTPYRHRSVWARAWRDGDDTTCAFNRETRGGMRCDPPVAVVLVRYTYRSSRRFGWDVTGRRRALCPLHLPHGGGVAAIAKAAYEAAHDRLVRAHPEEFKRYLDEETRRRRAAASGKAMSMLAGILDGDTGGPR
ncbi:hypothetical protein ACFMQL_20345 [Nonomuraea fastidiosa]|uniref:hypothetical protein n=1 Tax=Nonomuraea fastidiosa TaxID=46173 RepID=UPI00366F1A4A